MFSWTVRENLDPQHISSSSHLVFSLGNVSPWFLLTVCAPVSPLWLAHFYALQNARNIRTLFTTYPLITVANNNLVFNIYIFTVVLLNRLKYFVKTSIDIVILWKDSVIILSKNLCSRLLFEFIHLRQCSSKVTLWYFLKCSYLHDMLKYL